jgi:hypothetical protein
MASMSRTKTPNRSLIAILGWGSLLWEAAPEFDQWHDPWRFDGPTLKLEFSRVSSSRKGVLTLVIDPQHGAPNPVASCSSRHAIPDPAIADLQRRERTIRDNIGRVSLAKSGDHYRDPATGEAIRTWAAIKGLDDVVWTDLPSNFNEKTGQAFSVAAGLDYLRTLDPTEQTEALEYIRRTPQFIQTPLRKALETDPWFAASRS